MEVTQLKRGQKVKQVRKARPAKVERKRVKRTPEKRVKRTQRKRERGKRVQVKKVKSRTGQKTNPEVFETMLQK